MSKIIKLRAWDKTAHEMYKQKDIARMTYYSEPTVYDDGYIKLSAEGEAAIGDHPIGKRHVLMQFTGLLDKNKKEIYEGDLIRCCGWNDCRTNKDRKWGSPFEVVWDNTNARFTTKGMVMDMIYGSFQYEIIGNIHENPSLIT